MSSSFVSWTLLLSYFNWYMYMVYQIICIKIKINCKMLTTELFNFSYPLIRLFMYPSGFSWGVAIYRSIYIAVTLIIMLEIGLTVTKINKYNAALPSTVNGFGLHNFCLKVIKLSDISFFLKTWFLIPDIPHEKIESGPFQGLGQ